MTPSAARGVLEAVLWKPAIAWHVERITVLAPIRFTAFRRNEVNSRIPRPPDAVVRYGGELAPYFADEDRAQRNTVALSGVDYLIDAHFTLTPEAGPENNIYKFIDMFDRRVRNGQHFHQPYLGCREFPADIFPPDGAPAPIPEDRDLGIMLWDIKYGAKRNEACFFKARLDRGVLVVPPEPDFRSNRETAGGAP